MRRHKRKTPSVTSTQLICTSSPASQPGMIAQTPGIRQNGMLGCSEPTREHAGPAALDGIFLGRCSPARSSKGRTKPVLARGPNWFENLAGNSGMGDAELVPGEPAGLPPLLEPCRGTWVTAAKGSHVEYALILQGGSLAGGCQRQAPADRHAPAAPSASPWKGCSYAGHLQPAHLCW